MVAAAILIPVLMGLLLFATANASLRRVPDGEVEILFVLGEPRSLLEPGLNFVPPFVSTTYPVDVGTMQFETDDGRESLPQDLRPEARRIASEQGRGRSGWE